MEQSFTSIGHHITQSPFQRVPEFSPPECLSRSAKMLKILPLRHAYENIGENVSEYNERRLVSYDHSSEISRIFVPGGLLQSL